jgi:hypothetical protein
MFTIFKQLPTELRLDIWEKALTAPRCIEMKFSPDKDNVFHWDNHVHHRGPPARSPAILFTNQESRKVALEHYVPFLHGTEDDWESFKITYIDPLRDIFLFVTFSINSERLAIQDLSRQIPNLARLAAYPIMTRFPQSLKSVELLEHLEEFMVVHLDKSRPTGPILLKELNRRCWNALLPYPSNGTPDFAKVRALGDDLFATRKIANKMRIGILVDEQEPRSWESRSILRDDGTVDVEAFKAQQSRRD